MQTGRRLTFHAAEIREDTRDCEAAVGALLFPVIVLGISFRSRHRLRSPFGFALRGFPWPRHAMDSSMLVPILIIVFSLRGNMLMLGRLGTSSMRLTRCSATVTLGTDHHNVATDIVAH